jgi:hypothetical protein
MTVISLTYNVPISFTIDGFTMLASGLTQSDVAQITDASVVSPVGITRANIISFFNGVSGNVIITQLTNELNSTATKNKILDVFNAISELDKRWSNIVYTVNLSTFQAKINASNSYPGVVHNPGDYLQFVFYFKDTTIGGTGATKSVGITFAMIA